MIKETPWHYYVERGERYRVKAEYGIDYAFSGKFNQAPDFHVTGTIERKARNNRWYEFSAGQVVDEMRAHIPEIAPYLKWHLVGPDSPMHYFANAKYWFEIAQGKRKESAYPTNPIEAFKHTIVYRAFPGDEAPLELQHDFENAESWRPVGAVKYSGPKEWKPGTSQKIFFRGVPWEGVEGWLEERLPKLQAAWVVDMAELGVLEE